MEILDDSSIEIFRGRPKYSFLLGRNNELMDEFSKLANLMGDPGRAAILLKLMGGIALPAGELARAANVAPQTASGHLGRMVEGRLLSVERQGRNRYYRLLNPEVGEAIEGLLRLTVPRAKKPGHLPQKAIAGTVAYARTCYSHLAGWLGVAITEAMVRDGLLIATDHRTYVVSPTGKNWLESVLAITIPSSEKPGKRFARQCLDWTERRHHLSGELGIAMYQRMLELKWIVSIPGTRMLRTTGQGKRKLWDLLRISLP